LGCDLLGADLAELPLVVGNRRGEQRQLTIPAGPVLQGGVDPRAQGVGLPRVHRSLSGLDELQAACATVRRAGRIEPAEAAAIRSALDGAVLPTASGGSLRVRFMADEGFIMRTGGPNGMSLVGPRSTGMNNHGSAKNVHADQDVYGTPMAQLMDGRAPELFVHDSPDGANHNASLHLVNLLQILNSKLAYKPHRFNKRKNKYKTLSKPNKPRLLNCKNK
jgi:hypothetical protein